MKIIKKKTTIEEIQKKEKEVKGNWGEGRKKREKKTWKRKKYLSIRFLFLFFFFYKMEDFFFFEGVGSSFNAATHLWISCGNPWPSSNSLVSSLPLPLVLPVVVEWFPQVRPIGSCPLPSQRSSICSRWHRDGRSILAEVRVQREWLLIERRRKKKGPVLVLMDWWGCGVAGGREERGAHIQPSSPPQTYWPCRQQTSSSQTWSTPWLSKTTSFILNVCKSLGRIDWWRKRVEIKKTKRICWLFFDIVVVEESELILVWFVERDKKGAWVREEKGKADVYQDVFFVFPNGGGTIHLLFLSFAPPPLPSKIFYLERTIPPPLILNITVSPSHATSRYVSKSQERLFQL